VVKTHPLFFIDTPSLSIWPTSAEGSSMAGKKGKNLPSLPSPPSILQQTLKKGAVIFKFPN